MNMHRKMPYDQQLIVIILCLTGFGLVMVFSASSAVSREMYGSASAIFMRQATAAAIGVLLLLAAMKVDYQFYGRAWVMGGLLTLATGLLALPLLMGGEGAARWIRVGPLQFQPSEAAKLAAIAFTAFYLSRRADRLESFSRGLLPHLSVMALLTALILAGKDLGTAACMLAVCGLLLYFAGLPYRHVPILAGAGGGVGALLIWLEPYRMQRILSFLDPGKDPRGAGYQIRQSLIAVGSGRLTGKGLADGTQKMNFLPEPHTDFIFSVLGEELGLVGCLALLLLFGAFLWRGVAISLRADSLFGLYLGLGIVGMVVAQALVNMSVAVQLLPTKGLPLPFISVGGSSLMTTLAASGILLNISKHTRSGGERPAWQTQRGEVPA